MSKFKDYLIECEESGQEDAFVDYDDSMDGDHASALASAGWGTDEDYGCCGTEFDMYGDYALEEPF